LTDFKKTVSNFVL